jgi:hypothetical protein
MLLQQPGRLHVAPRCLQQLQLAQQLWHLPCDALPQ